MEGVQEVRVSHFNVILAGGHCLRKIFLGLEEGLQFSLSHTIIFLSHLSKNTHIKLTRRSFNNL
jgi:hypothetical protein